MRERGKEDEEKGRKGGGREGGQQKGGVGKERGERFPMTTLGAWIW